MTARDPMIERSKTNIGMDAAAGERSVPGSSPG